MSHFQKITALLMAALLLFSLAACGQSDLEGQQGQKAPDAQTDADDSSSQGNASSDEKSSYYSAVHTLLSAEIAPDAACVQDGVFYFVADTLQPNGQVFGNYLMRLDPETGKSEKVEPFETQRNDIRKENQDVSMSIDTLAAGADGILVMTAQCNTILMEEETEEGAAAPSGEDADEIATTINYPRLLAAQPDGTILWTAKLAEDTSDFLTRELVRDAAGYTYLLDINGDLKIVDSEGTLVLSLEDCGHRLAMLADGRVVTLKLTAGKNAWTVLQPDISAKQLQTLGSIAVSQTGGDYDALFLPGTDGYDLYCAGSLSLYGLKLSDSETPENARQVLSWLNCDIDGTGLMALANDENGGFLALVSGTSQTPEAVRLTGQDIDPNQEKITLTMACRELPSSVSAAVRKFNSQSAEYRIVIQDYGAASVDGIDRLTTDLNAGNIPDLFCTDGIDLQTLIVGGWLEDLWSYIDADEVLTRDSLVESLFNAMSVNDGLYTVTGGFTLKTTLALSAIAGDEPGWSISEMQQTASSLPQLETLGGTLYTRESVMEDILQYYSEGFIDRAAGEASFDSAEFVELLEYAYRFPAEKKKRGVGDLLEGRQLFTQVEIYDLLRSRFTQISNTGRNDVTVWKGYPGIAGSGSVFCPETPMAMAANGKHKEAAWEFLRSILLPENQGYNSFWGENNDSYNSLPSNRSVFEAMIQEMCHQPKELTTTYKNAYGESAAVKGWSNEEADAFRALVDNTVTVQQPENTLSGILRDEIQRFFAGQQDASAAANAIQNRVQLYLAELG